MTDNWFVLKDVLPVKKFLNLYEVIDPIKPNNWVLNNYSDINDRNDSNGKVFWTINLFDHLLPFYDAGSYIKYKIKKKIKHNINLMRIHTNGQTSNQDSTFHTDDGEYYYTFVLFSNSKWNIQYGGNFNFYNPEEKEYHSIPYMPNTGVLIPSNWDHYGAPPFSRTDTLRTTVSFMYIISEHIEKETYPETIKKFKYYNIME